MTHRFSKSHLLLGALSLGSALWLASPAARAVSFSTPDGVAGTPRTQTGGGASRTSGQCLAGSETSAAIRPLTPNFQRVLTVSERPTFYVSVPPTTAKTASFSLQDEASELHYRTEVELSADGGIVAIPLPDDAPELATGEDYTWYFEVHCAAGFDPNNPTIDGTVYRMPVEESLAGQLADADTPIEAARVYGESGIWYDALSELAAARRLSPSDRAVAENWSELLSSVGLDAVANQSIED